MGNLCGKASPSDPFDSPGRTLGSAPPPPSATKASIPSNIAPSKPKVGGPPRTLGDETRKDDPKAAAAAAAQARANKSTTSTAPSTTKSTSTPTSTPTPTSPPTSSHHPAQDLQKKLDAQKRQTHKQTLHQAALENRLAREADAARETRLYN